MNQKRKKRSETSVLATYLEMWFSQKDLLIAMAIYEYMCGSTNNFAVFDIKHFATFLLQKYKVKETYSRKMLFDEIYNDIDTFINIYKYL